MDLSTEEAVLPLEEMLDRDSDKRYELIDGKLVEKNEMGALANDFAAQLFTLLGIFIRSNKLGRYYFDTEYKCFGTKIRRPDFSFITGVRLSKNDVPRGFLTIPPDLAAEVLSPNDLIYDVNKKVVDYLNGGVKEIWLINPELRIISIRRPGVPTTELDENSDLTSDLLPGFSIKVGEIYQ